MDSSADHFILD